MSAEAPATETPEIRNLSDYLAGLTDNKEKVNVLRFLAQSAELTERFDDICAWSTAFVEAAGKIDVDDRDLLYAGFKKAVSRRRTAVRSLRSDYAAPSAFPAVLKAYENKILGELKGIVEKAIEIAKNQISSSDDDSSLVYFNKAIGDYARYATEFTTDEERKKYVQIARDGYSNAEKHAKELPKTNTLYLAFVLNHSVFLYDVLDEKTRALSLSRATVDDFIGSMESAPTDDNVLIVQLMRENVEMWESQV